MRNLTNIRKIAGSRACMLLMAAAAVVVIAGCAWEKYGDPVRRDLKTLKVKDIMLDPSLQGKTVNLEGTITIQCMSNGCWFFLDDGTGQIYINLAPKGFSLPPRSGRPAKLTGVVQPVEDAFQILALGVEVKQ